MTTPSYFGNFPNTVYNGTTIPNIFMRVKFLETLRLASSVYYPYVIEEGETADGIASWYYGSPVYDWVIYLANNIIDPYSQWPKTSAQFSDYIIKTYGSIQAAQSEILFYRREPDIGYLSPDGSQFSSSPQQGYNVVVNNTDLRITPSSYATIQDPANYFPVYAYDYENELNENKRNISLIDKSLLQRIVSELSGLLNA